MTTGHGLVPVGETPQTGVPGIHTVGNAKPGPPFTRGSYDDSRILRDRSVPGLDAKPGDRLPNMTFSDRRLAAAG